MTTMITSELPAGVYFIGMQELAEGKLIPLYNDTEYGMTFTPGAGETVQQAYERKRKEFANADVCDIIEDALNGRR